MTHVFPPFSAFNLLDSQKEKKKHLMLERRSGHVFHLNAESKQEPEKSNNEMGNELMVLSAAPGPV